MSYAAVTQVRICANNTSNVCIEARMNESNDFNLVNKDNA